MIRETVVKRDGILVRENYILDLDMPTGLEMRREYYMFLVSSMQCKAKEAEVEAEVEVEVERYGAEIGVYLCREW